MSNPGPPSGRHSAVSDRMAIERVEDEQSLAHIMRWWSIVRRRPLVPIVMAVLAATAMWIHQSRLPSVYQAKGVLQMGMTAVRDQRQGDTGSDEAIHAVSDPQDRRFSCY